MYGTTADGDTYFASRLNVSAWTSASSAEKTSALKEATQLIDNLNYSGDKTSSTQVNEFPRDDDTTVPTNIEYATYELALTLLDGRDVDNEMMVLRNETNAYENVKESYQRGVIPEWIIAGIISAKAWLLLKPYLHDSKTLTISRGP